MAAPGPAGAFDPRAAVATFAAVDADAVVRALVRAGYALAHDDRHYEATPAAADAPGDHGRLWLPAVLGTPPDLVQWLADGPHRTGTQALILLQAGAAALGVRAPDDTWLAHKVIKKYVVRGNGKAQPTHLKTKGKSRYGSRLRLQNHRRLLEQVRAWLNERLAAAGAVQRIHIAAPERLLAELHDGQPALPFTLDEVAAVPFEVRRPSFEELGRVWRKLSRGRWQRTAATEGT